MANYNYWCFNCNNKDYFVISKELEDKTEEKCPNCGGVLKKMGECLTYLGGKFTSMSREQKIENLKKRSSNHFKTHIQERKKDMDQNYW